MLTSPALSAASVMASASAKLGASGFSQSTCLPAAIIARVVALCAPSGVQLIAASKPPQPTASSRLSK